MNELAGLVALAQQTDRCERQAHDAFAKIVSRFQDMAYGCALGILGDHHMAQDAAQEAFITAWRCLGQLKDPDAFPGWFRRIVQTQCHRTLRRPQTDTVPYDEALLRGTRTTDPHEELLRKELRQAVQSAIDSLPEFEHQVTILYYVAQYSQPEIARFLELPLTTIKKRLHTARQRLKKGMLKMVGENLSVDRPSQDDRFVQRVQRMIQPDELKSTEVHEWSGGIGNDVWAIIWAAANGDLQTIRTLVDKEPKLINCTYGYKPPLHFAVRENQVDAVRLLLELGADATKSWPVPPLVMARDRGYAEMEALLAAELEKKHGVSPRVEPVIAAIKARDAARAKALLDADPTLLHAADDRGSQPIHWAVMTRQMGLIDDLLGMGADINARRPDGARPLDLTNGDYWYRGGRDVGPEAVQRPDVLAGYLIARGAEYDLPNAAKFGDLARVREILDAQPGLIEELPDYVTWYSGYPLRKAAEAGHMEVVKLLLERGADPNFPEPGVAPRGGALQVAVFKGWFEIARLLLEHGADPNQAIESSGNCMWAARVGGDQKMIDLLASHGSVTGVYNSAYDGDIQTLAAMFTANPALADDAGAFELAIGKEEDGLARLFLKFAPAVVKRVRADQVKTPPLLEHLLENGMDVNASNWYRATALHFVAERGDLERAELLLDRGAEIDAVDEEFRSTPLGWAARAGQEAMVELLLARGAAVDIPGQEPWAAALSWAERRGHKAIATILCNGLNSR